MVAETIPTSADVEVVVGGFLAGTVAVVEVGAGVLDSENVDALDGI